MNILYVPNHAVLEFDELRIFSEFADSIFSAWFYADPENPIANVRPSLGNVPLNQRAAEIWKRESLNRESCLLSREFVDCFDVIVAVADARKIDYLTSVASRPLAIRTIGQSTPTYEASLRLHRNKISIVRYSPAERTIPGYAGEDTIIRFGKYPEDFEKWVGGNQQVTTLYSNMSRRLVHASFEAYKGITEPFPRIMYGGGNPEGPWTADALPYEEMLRMYSRASVYYCCHTAPASYTLNLMEAMMTGCPIVTPGRSIIAEISVGDWDASPAYEVPDFLDSADFVACANDVEAGRASIAALLADRDLAERVGKANRARAIELFSSRPIAEQWKAHLNSII